MKYITYYLMISFSILFLLMGCTKSEKEQSQPPIQKETTQVNDPQETPTKQNQEMKVHFIDVGQGDSILIQLPNKKSILVDGGVKGAGKEVVTYIRDLKIKQLSLVVATHPDADHIGGLIPVLNAIKVNQFMDAGKVHTSQTYEEMLQLIADKNIKFTVPTIGQQIKLDSNVSIEILSVDEFAADNNDASIVLKLTYNEVSFLLMADASIQMEQDLLATHNLKATILKAGHHGSNTSSSLAFLQAVKPEVAILSYGNNNKYGHPHAEVIDGLRTVGSKIYGTGESGTITVLTDGLTYTINQPEWTGVGATSSISWQTNNDTQNNELQITPTSATVYISQKDLEKEFVTITNGTTENINLKDWKLLSVEGNQIFNFPNITLQAGQSIRITSGADAKEGTGYLKWTGRQIWLNDGDQAILYNAKGEVVSELN